MNNVRKYSCYFAINHCGPIPIYQVICCFLSLFVFALPCNSKFTAVSALFVFALPCMKMETPVVTKMQISQLYMLNHNQGGGPRIVVNTAAFHARVRGSVPGLGGLKETKMFLPHPRVKVSIAGSLRDREVACSASDRQGTNFESCVWRQCHLNHLTILRRVSWPSLAYMCTKVAQSPIHFISFL